MNLYTHAVLANHLLTRVDPVDPAEYLWGAVAPDIRYLAGMSRQTTHLPDEEIVAWFTRYSGCKSFIQGYRVHCLLDQIDTVEVVGRVFPLNLLRWVSRKKLSSQQMAVVIELYYHKVFPQGLSLAGKHNPILEDLGIRADLTASYKSALAEYLASPSFETAIASFAKFGIIEDTRIEKYINAYRRIESNPLLLWVLMTSVKNAQLEKLAALSYPML